MIIFNTKDTVEFGSARYIVKLKYLGYEHCHFVLLVSFEDRY